jgi:hypothetical protein
MVGILTNSFAGLHSAVVGEEGTWFLSYASTAILAAAVVTMQCNTRDITTGCKQGLDARVQLSCLVGLKTIVVLGGAHLFGLGC